MSITGSTVGLVNAVNETSDKLNTLANGILCIPSILSNLPSILGSVATSVTAGLAAYSLQLLQGISDSVVGIVANQLGEITGAVSALANKLLSVEQDILGAVSVISKTIKDAYDRIDDIKDSMFSADECKFAAAQLMSCVAGSLLSNVTNKIGNEVSRGLTSIDNAASNITSKAVSGILSPGNVVDQYVSKTSATIDKATAQVKTMSIL